MSLLLLIGLPSISHAQDKIASTGLWQNAGTWSPSGVPDNNEVILIPSGVVVTVKGLDLTLINAILIIEGELIMDKTTLLYSSLIFLGLSSGIIVEDGGKITDGTAFGGDLHFISSQGTTFWSGDNCALNCGSYEGSFTASLSVSSPLDLTNPLPVDMISFNANQHGESIMLEWATATELNNSHFEIERSNKDFDFYKIGEVEGTGNSNTRIEYSFKDYNLPSSSDKLYYRIKQVDFDGKYEYSEVTTIHAGSTEPLVKIWPNPFDEKITIFLESSTSDHLRLSMRNLKGQEVFSQSCSIHEGQNKIEIDKLPDLPQGIYSLSLMGNALYFEQKIVSHK